MKLQYLGHASFRIISETGTAIITDPYDADMVGFSMPRISCDVVTVSHSHADHNAIHSVKGAPAVLEKETYVAVDDIAVQSIHSWHDDKQGKLRGENYVFCFLVDGLRVVHMGDIGVFDASLAQKLAGCDVLLIPVGSVFTVDAVGAKQYVDAIQPKIVVPMHYQTPQLKFQLEPVTQFTNLFPQSQVRFAHTETLNVNDQPQLPTQVVVLDKYDE